MGKTIGIDLGTTNSVVSFYDAKSPGIILSQEGDRILPSVVAFMPNDERLVGNPAKSQLITNPENTIHSIKRLMGKRFTEIEPFLNHYTYTIVKGDEDTLRIKINEKLFSPEEISALILGKLKESAEHFFGERIESAIITVPAYFNDSQRQATKDASEIAGLNVLRIINEPTAASLAFSLDLKKKAKVVVYDFGGGTIDISILEIDNEIIKVIATAGNSGLGGNDLDIQLSDLLVKEFSDEFNLDLSGNKLAIQRIREAAEIAKKELSSLDACEINLPFIADSSDGPIHFLKYLTRNEFENLIMEKVNKTLEILEFLLTNSNIDINEIDELLLVGGSTRIPLVQTKVREFFKKEPNKKINPDEIVAMGAAVQGAITKGETKDILLLDVIPLSLGVKTFGGTFTRIIEANTTIPIDKSLVFSTAEDNQEEVEISTYQGEREIAEENKLLGKFTLKGIRPAPKGVPRIEVIFSININGILMVSAIDLSNKNKKEVVVSHTGLLTEEEIRKIKENSEKFKEVDLKKKELINKKTKILNFIYSLDQVLTQKKVTSKLKTECNKLIEKASQVVEKEIINEMEDITEKLDELNNRLNSMDLETVNPEIKESVESSVEEEPPQQKRSDTRPLKFKQTQQEIEPDSERNMDDSNSKKKDAPPKKKDGE